MSYADRDGVIWMDGEMVPWRDAQVHVLTHTLHYGVGAFEGIRAYETPKGTAIFRLDDHVRRLFETAHILEMKMPYSREEIARACVESVKQNKLETAYLRPLVYYGSEGMGLHATSLSVHVAIASWYWGAYLGTDALEKGIRIKRDGYDEALLLDADGMVAEGSGENIFIVRNGIIYTPELTSALEGITRDTVLQLAAEEGYTVIEKRITRDEIYISDEAFFTGTAAEVTPIRELDNRTIGSGGPGPVTQQLQRVYLDVVEGKRDGYDDWLTVV